MATNPSDYIPIRFDFVLFDIWFYSIATHHQSHLVISDKLQYRQERLKHSKGLDEQYESNLVPPSLEAV